MFVYFFFVHGINKNEITVMRKWLLDLYILSIKFIAMNTIQQYICITKGSQTSCNSGQEGI